jgi:hypothetical protein
MNQEAMQKLEQFRQMHLATDGEQTDKASESSAKRINYPDHIKPLKERIMSALANGCRTPESVANYCGTEDIKLINLQLCRWVSRGLIGRHTNVVSGITRFYPHDIAKEKGFLTAPKPINRKKGKKAKLKTENRSSSYQSPAPTTQLTQAEAFVLRGEATKSQLAGKDYIAFLEKRVLEWQQEARKQAHEIEDLKAKLSEAQVQLIKARQTRDVTSEVTEVMQEVTKLRATVEYLESKLFGRK